MNEEETGDLTETQKFEKINDELRKEIESEYYFKMLELFRVEKMEDGYHKYQLGNAENSYIRYITNEELRAIIKLAIDLLEEMKVINNAGVNRTEYDRILEEEKVKEKEENLAILYAWRRIETDKMKSIIFDIDRAVRIAGA